MVSVWDEYGEAEMSQVERDVDCSKRLFFAFIVVLTCVYPGKLQTTSPIHGVTVLHCFFTHIYTWDRLRITTV